jgi:hypothetical protein
MPHAHHHHATSTEDGHGHHGSPHDHDQAQVLDLDAEVLAEHIAAITAWLPVRAAPREIVEPARSLSSASSRTLTSPPSTPRPDTSNSSGPGRRARA